MSEKKDRFNEWANAKFDAIKEIKYSSKCAEMLPCGLCGITNKVCPSANTTYATGTQTTVTDIPISYTVDFCQKSGVADDNT